MTDNVQASVSFPASQYAALEQLSAQSGRSLASIIREAVSQFLQASPVAAPLLTADVLWAVLRDPQHWQTFKQIAIEMEGVPQAEPGVTGSVEPVPAPPQPTWKFRRGDGVAGRNNAPPALPEDDEPPF